MNATLIILNFIYYNLNAASTFGAEMWLIIETKFEGCPALMPCLLKFQTHNYNIASTSGGGGGGGCGQ